MSYTDINPTVPNALSFGTPTITPQAAMANIGGAVVPTGISAAPGVGGAPQVTVPGGMGGVGVGGAGAQGANPGFFSQGGMGQFALGAIQTLGSLWNSFQQNKLAKESFKFQKQAYNTNLENQEQSYNTALQDRINSRYVTEGKSQAEADSYIAENRL